MSYHDERPKRCKLCKGKLAQKFSTSSIKVDGSYKTLGSLADANAAKMTEEQKQRALDESRTKKKFDPRLGPKDPSVFTAMNYKPGPKTHFSSSKDVSSIFEGTPEVKVMDKFKKKKKK